ncbi:MAG: DUF6989 domain-containing protein [Candidatus Hermodarchaeia archaeon]
MNLSLESTERDVLFIHLFFIVLCAIVLLVPIPILVGPRLFILVMVYNIMIPLTGWWRKHTEWLNLWFFAFLLSLLMLFPDWFLADPLGILVFVDDGFPNIGPVTGYMLLLWAIPLFIITFIGLRVVERRNEPLAYGVVALTSFLIFVGAEAGLTFVWHAQNVFMIGSVATYIIIPEIILGISSFWMYQHIKAKPHWWKLIGAFLIMLLYLGSACCFYFLIDRLILGT